MPITTDSSVGSRIALNVRRNEYRYLLGSGQAQRIALERNLSQKRLYRTRTLYLDTPGGSWSINLSQRKFRLRQYNDESIWWFEIKSNVEGAVEKHRRQVTPQQVDELGLKPIMVVTYSREEYSSVDPDNPSTLQIEGTRVTIDTGVTVSQVPAKATPSIAMREPGTPLAALTNLVLEIKANTPIPIWLPLPQQWPGSKSRWGLTALHHLGDMWAPTKNLITG